MSPISQQPKSRTAPSDLRTQDGRELSFTDAKMLEDMRVTSAVSDIAYRNACVKLGVPPRPRPTKAVTPTTQTIVPFHVQGEAYDISCRPMASYSARKAQGFLPSRMPPSLRTGCEIILASVMPPLLTNVFQNVRDWVTFVMREF